MVLRIGILFNKSLNNFNIRFPINDNDNQPINVINITEIKISRPGTEKGKYEFGLISFGINFDETLMMNKVK